MKLEMEVISREVITPSSPTPQHLTNYKLSYLDQIMPHHLTPFLFFYPYNGNEIRNSDRSNHLKKSLSRALTLFYPLAGRLVGNSYVNCNDEGVTYVEAQANNCKFSDVITDPNPEELSKFVDDHAKKDHCMAVQATFFCCGGLALGLEISHKVFDGFSQFMFLNCWASFSRGGDELIRSPKFESAAILFPPKDSVREYIVLDKKENVVTKRFVFSSTKIAQLRDKYTKTKSIRPTRIEALLTFIGTRFMVAIRAKDDVSKAFALRIFVDIRARVVPPLSKYHFGNIVAPAIITVPNSLINDDGDGTTTNGGIVKKMRDAIRNVDTKLCQPNHESLFATKASESEAVVMLSFTNYCSFPSHEANFGWGIPMMIGGTNIPMNNMVCFNNSLSGGGGIDAWVNLKEEDMIKFEADKELLDYVSDTKFMSMSRI